MHWRDLRKKACALKEQARAIRDEISQNAETLSDEEIDYLLMNDIHRCRRELESEYDWFEDLDSVRQEALIDLSFNIGQTRLRGFVKALGHMADGNYTEAGDEFYDSKWATQVGDRALEICQMIRSGEYQER